MGSDLDAGWREGWPPGQPVYAHTPNVVGEWHSLADHSRVVGNLAADFAAGFGGGGVARFAGYVHDAGKLTSEVQVALRKRAVDGGKKLGVPHKSEGSALAAAYFAADQKIVQTVIALAVFGHHSQIPNTSRIAELRAFKHPELLELLAERLEVELGGALAAAAAEVRTPTHLDRELSADLLRDVELFIRMVHSAVVDADFLDTSAHFTASGAARLSCVIGMDRLRDHFMQWYATRYAAAAASGINTLRQHVFDRCVEVGREHHEASIFRLPAPTGSGKTMAAAAFALNHAAGFGKKRVIVAVPFTSITTQNAAEYRTAFSGLDPQIVLEHHSNVIDPAVADDAWRRLSAENWDAEFVITTTVQLFESIFSGRPSAARKLHRIANSVIVLDEIQALPIALLPTILRVLRQLTENYGVTVLLASATQPTFWHLPVWSDVPHVDILSVDEVPAVTQRVRYEVRESKADWDSIADEVATERRALVIVNTTTDAQVMHRLLDERSTYPVLHLSTRMCGQHRADVLCEIRRRFAEDEPVTVVSTQLVEAGVDLDFPVVFRAIAPAESLVQSAGRCNREGKLGIQGGRVVVFDPSDGHLPAGIYGSATRLTKDMFVRQGRDLSDPAALADYYIELYRKELTGGGRSDTIDQARCTLDFPQVDQRFRMIEDTTTSVVVTDYGSALDREAVASLLEALRREPRFLLSRSQRQLLQRFSASLSTRRATESLLVEDVAGLSVWGGEYHPDRGLVLDSVGTIW